MKLARREVLIWVFDSCRNNLGLIYQCYGIDILVTLLRYHNTEYTVFKVILLWEMQDV